MARRKYDLSTEDLVSFTKSKSLPGKPHPTTMRRYATNGVLSKVNGRRVKLESIRIGGCRFTSRQAYSRFIVRQNAKPRSRHGTPHA